MLEAKAPSLRPPTADCAVAMGIPIMQPQPPQPPRGFLSAAADAAEGRPRPGHPWGRGHTAFPHWQLALVLNCLLACACLAALFAPSISQRPCSRVCSTRSVCAAGTCGAYWQAGGSFGYQLSVVCTWCATLIAWAFVCRAQGPQVVGAAVACGCLLVSIVSTHVAGNTGGNDAANSTDTWFGAGWYFQIVAACLAAGLALVGCRALPSRRDQSGGGAAALSHVLRPAFQPLPPPTVVAVEMLAVRAAAPAVADILNLAPEAGDDEDDELPVNRTAPRTVARLGAGGQRAQV